jgi:hypothetical protein
MQNNPPIFRINKKTMRNESKFNEVKSALDNATNVPQVNKIINEYNLDFSNGQIAGTRKRKANKSRSKFRTSKFRRNKSRSKFRNKSNRK